MNRKERKIRPLIFIFAVLGLLIITAPLQAETQEIIVTVENLAPAGGFYFTPVWVGLHNGSFDLFDLAGLASEGVERFAEDGLRVMRAVRFVAALDFDLETSTEAALSTALGALSKVAMERVRGVDVSPCVGVGTLWLAVVIFHPRSRPNGRNC